jgi:hypothetical protein
MANDINVIHKSSGWYVETPLGPIGPMDSQQEADQFLCLMKTASIARAEMGCTDAECFT